MSSREEVLSSISKDTPEESSFWKTPATRWEALVLGGTGGTIAIGAAALGSATVRDVLLAQEERERESENSPIVADTLRYMREHNLTPNEDPLYGFKFPSSADIASQFAQELNQPYVEGAATKLWIVHEVETKSFIRSRRQFFGLEQKPHRNVKLDEYNEGNGIIYLPPWFNNQDPSARATQFYYIGLQRYIEPAKSAKTPFDEVNMPHIGKILLERGYAIQFPDLHRALLNPLHDLYWEAVEKDDKPMWERALKQHLDIK